MRHPKILYWKWDEEVVTGGRLAGGLADCMGRFAFDLLYVSFHHVHRPFADPLLQAAIRQAAQTLAEDGRGLLLDIDARGEVADFLRHQPEGEGESVRFWEHTLDESGACAFVRENPVRGHVGRARCATGPERCFAWIFEKDGPGTYRPGSLMRAEVTLEERGESTAYRVQAGSASAGKTALIAPIFTHAIPDLFHESLHDFYGTMFDLVKDLPLGGAANDEWGYDLALSCEDGLFFVDAFPYSKGMKSRYAAQTSRDLDEDMLCFAVAPSDQPGMPIRVIRDYLSILRGRMRENNDWFYSETKRRFGPDAFVGVHPTFWGDPTDFSVDVLHNALDWWEVRRDFAQTDEFVIMPIRLALAHKWGGPFYNMWYSGNTQQLDTYWEESWNNARFGGRTHHLGYECPNEPGVYRLKHPGGLEGVEAMERRIAELDGVQRSLPDCRVLVVFGAEAVSNWYLARKEALVVRGQGLLPQVLRFTNTLFETYLCDLMPSTEIGNGSVRFERATPQGALQACYGTQRYDAVVYLAPECMEARVLQSLQRYAESGGRLLLAGECTFFADGALAQEEFAALCRCATRWERELPSAAEAVRVLRAWGVPENRFHNGCAYQDGSLVFTARGTQPTGNPLHVDCVHEGRTIRVEGEDFCYVPPEGDAP